MEQAIKRSWAAFLSPALAAVVAWTLIAVVGRWLCGGLPNVQPVTAICVFVGMKYGWRQGLFVGVMTAFLSNQLMGQGLWTLFQAVGWGLTGVVAGVMAGRLNKVWMVCLFGFVMSLVFGLIMDSMCVYVASLFSIEAAMSIYAAGIPFNTIHAWSTVMFLLVLYQVRSWIRF